MVTPHSTNAEAPKGQEPVSALCVPPLHEHAHVLSSDLVSIKYKVLLIDGQSRLVQLVLEASHPKLPGVSRDFDLSPMLESAYRKHPRTVNQVIDPKLSMESRIDALQSLLLDIAGPTVRIPCTNQATDKPIHSHEMVDELEPSFTIQNALLTEFGDLMRGCSRRAVNVLRNNSEWIQFLVIEHESELRHANIAIPSLDLEWPLLDRKGRYATNETIDQVLHDFTYLLRTHRSASAEVGLECLGGELMRRMRRSSESPECLQRRDFVQEAWSAVKETISWAPPFHTPNISEHLAPPGGGFFSRALPDGRCVWIQFDQDGPMPAVVRLIGDSLVGSRYKIEFHYSADVIAKAHQAFIDLSFASGWPSFHTFAHILRTARKSAISFQCPTGAEAYSTGLNSLLESINERAETVVGRGWFSVADSRISQHLGEFAREFVVGRLPVWGTFDCDDPAHSWVVQAFFDEHLNGRIFMSNSLRGSIIFESSPGSSFEAKREEICNLFARLQDSPDDFATGNYSSKLLSQTRINLPTTKQSDVYLVANQVALTCWRAVRSAGHFRSASSANDASWKTQEITDDQWVVSLHSPFTRGTGLPYLINLYVSCNGVHEISLSRGTRGPLGGLIGARLLPGRNTTAFTHAEVDEIIQLACYTKHGSIDRSKLRIIRPDIYVKPLASLRALDPEALHYDRIAQFLNWWRGN